MLHHHLEQTVAYRVMEHFHQGIALVRDVEVQVAHGAERVGRLEALFKIFYGINPHSSRSGFLRIALNSYNF